MGVESRIQPRARVLIVDDDEELRDVLAEALELESYTVLEAASGQEGLDCARSWHPDVVVTDVNMPGMSGLELSDELLRDKSSPPPRVVVISGVPAAGAEARRRGASAFLTKPFSLEELTLTLDGLLGGKPRPAELDRISQLKARARAATRAMAEAAAAAGLAEPENFVRANRATRWLSKFFDASTVSILVPREGKLTIRASSDPALVNRGDLPPALVEIVENVLATHSTVIVPDVAAQPWLGIDSPAFRSILSVPFWFRDVPVGILCLSGSTQRAFDASDVAIIEYIAKQSTSQLMTGTAALFAPSLLLAPAAFRKILNIDANGAADHHDGIAIVLFRMAVDRNLGELLERLPAGRMQLGQLGSDLVGLAVRAPGTDAHRAARAGAALVRSQAEVAASAGLFIGPPVPPTASNEALAWAERLLDATVANSSDNSHVWVDARAVWTARDDYVELR